jgi:hypothetical protein
MSAAHRKKRKKKDAELTPEELARQKGESLPDREVMSTISVEPQPVVGDEGVDVLFPLDPTPKGVA